MNNSAIPQDQPWLRPSKWVYQGDSPHVEASTRPALKGPCITAGSHVLCCPPAHPPSIAIMKGLSASLIGLASSVNLEASASLSADGTGMKNGSSSSSCGTVQQQQA